ncbi:MAG: aminopeptidase P family protein [Clostridia bacterium]
MYDKRVSSLINIIEQKDLDGVIITSRDNTMYLSSFSGTDSILVFTRKKAYFATDFRYIETASSLSAYGYEVVLIEEGVKSIVALLSKLFTSKGLRIGYENTVPYGYFETLKQGLKDCVYYDISDQMLAIRSVKDETELSFMSKAAAIADIAFNHILKTVKIGMSEIEVAAELEYVMKKNGASFPAFDTIAVSGKKTSMPHGVPDSKKLMNHDTVTLDFGANYKGYCSDMTRTFFIGSPSAEMIKIYNIVYKAQKEAQDYVKEGVSGFNADKVARDIIEIEGYGKYFGHSTGHGVGLLIHEEPRLSVKSKAVLKSNMTVTVEPGIYIPDLGGVRIENTVVVEKGGCYPLNHSNKEMIII